MYSEVRQKIIAFSKYCIFYASKIKMMKKLINCIKNPEILYNNNAIEYNLRIEITFWSLDFCNMIIL